ncbi:glutamate receptor-like isoform X2 [Palaemon carinicauda]|uniref:glutamate receptor-like isoform X2 n=1 Tax=Palaemon carinicauda TaxID=392227 RepID=UPI0035B67234
MAEYLGVGPLPLVKIGYRFTSSNGNDDYHPSCYFGRLQSDVVTTLIAMEGKHRPSLVQLLYDEEHKETAESLSKMLSSRMSGFLMFQYESSLKPARRMIEMALGMTLLLVICSPGKIVQIFSEINLDRLDSHLVRWLLVLRGNDSLDEVILGLGGLIFEGTRVTVVAEVSRGTPVVFATAVDTDGVTRFYEQGKWGKTAGTKERHLQDLLEPDELRPCNMKGRVLNVTALERMPHFGISQPNPDGTVNATGGFELMLLETLGSVFNFTFRVILPEDGSFGNPRPDGTVTGMIGLVARREASLAFGGVTLTDSRDRVIDFSYPFFQAYLSIFSTPPEQKSRALAVLSPFTYEVWISVIISIVAIGPILYGISKAARKIRRDNLDLSAQRYSFNMFRNIVNQGNALSLSFWSERIILFSWFIFCLVCVALYSGTLTAVFAVPSYEKPINSLEDLPKAVKRGLTLCVNGATTHEFIFKEAVKGIFKDTWALFNHKDRSESFLSGMEVGVSRVLTGKYLYISTENKVRFVAAPFGLNKFHVGTQKFFFHNLGMAISSGVPYRSHFDRMLLRMIEGGLLIKWDNDIFYKLAQSSPANNEGEKKSNSSAITLEHLQGAFLMVVFGYLIAVLVLAIENAAVLMKGKPH